MRRTAVIAGALLVILIAVLVVFLHPKGGKAGTATPTATATSSVCNLQLYDDVVIVQDGKEMRVPALALKMPVDNLILAEGTVELTFTVSEGNKPAEKVQTELVTEKEKIPKVTDGFGEALFTDVELFLDGQTQRDNLFTFHYGGCETKFALLVGKDSPRGSVNPTGPIGTSDQMGVPAQPDQPHTVNFTVDPAFVAAFAHFCGFSPDQVTRVGLIPNDIPRFQVAWTGTEFVQANSMIMPGQYIWSVWFGDQQCIINPPCGNPTVPPNVLPPSPPEEQLPPPPGKEVPPSTATPTAPAGSPPPPSATNTPKPPNTATTVPPTATRVPPTSTPRPPATQTPAPTYTPPPSGCPNQPACPGQGFNFPTVTPTPGQGNPEPRPTVKPPDEPPPAPPTVPPTALPTRVPR